MSFLSKLSELGFITKVRDVITGGAYSFPKADGNADDVLTTNGSGVVSFQPISNLNVPSFLVFGQEANLSGQTNFEMKTTNGAQCDGWKMPVAGTATHISLQLDVKTEDPGDSKITAQLVVNASAQAGAIVEVATTSTGRVGDVAALTPISFSAGDTLTLYLTHTGTATTGDHAGLVRILTST